MSWARLEQKRSSLHPGVLAQRLAAKKQQKNTTDKQIKAGSLGDTDDGKEAQQGRQVAMDGQASVQKDGKGVYVLWENGSGSRPGP